MFYEIATLCAFAFLAGFIDSIVGGGGLIQLPALFIILPALVPASVFGTNKLAALAGTSVATLQYLKRVKVDRALLLPTIVSAFIFSFLGAKTVTLMRPEVLRPLILALLILVAIYTWKKKDFGSLHAPKLSGTKQKWLGIATGALLGFYDGFFGPGTGSFLIFIFVGIFGYSFLIASASAKLVNVVTNLPATVYFAASGHILYEVALPMAVFNIIGSTVGARLAIVKGSAFVRILFLVIVSALIIRLAYETL